MLAKVGFDLGTNGINYQLVADDKLDHKHLYENGDSGAIGIKGCPDWFVQTSKLQYEMDVVKAQEVLERCGTTRTLYVPVILSRVGNSCRYDDYESRTTKTDTQVERATYVNRSI